MCEHIVTWSVVSCLLPWLLPKTWRFVPGMGKGGKRHPSVVRHREFRDGSGAVQSSKMLLAEDEVVGRADKDLKLREFHWWSCSVVYSRQRGNIFEYLNICLT